ncbi:hypothetical protein V6N13_034666 [Hibiscus sabdariffa]
MNPNYEKMVYRKWDVTATVVQRAEQNGYKAIVLTGEADMKNKNHHGIVVIVKFIGGYASNDASTQSDGVSSNTTIFVGGLDPNVTEEDLRQPFSQYGEIVSVKIPVGKGCGFVQFTSSVKKIGDLSEVARVVPAVNQVKLHLVWQLW